MTAWWGIGPSYDPPDEPEPEEEGAGCEPDPEDQLIARRERAAFSDPGYAFGPDGSEGHDASHQRREDAVMRAAGIQGY